MDRPIPKLDLFINGAATVDRLQAAKQDAWPTGRWHAAARGRRLPVVNPSTESEVGTVPSGGREDVDSAVTAAACALPKWSSTPVLSRSQVLEAIAAAIETRHDELAALESVDMGKPLDESKWDMEDVAACFRFYAQLALDELGSDGSVLQSTDLGGEDAFESGVMQQPLGVVGLITPWNYPLLMATWKVAPALAAGCTVVLKPSEHASLTCLLLGEIASKAGLPNGALNVVSGLGSDAGAALVRHPGVQKLAFTGSNLTGRDVAVAAARALKPVTLELGGKSALIVFDDVDVDHAVEWAMFGCFWTNGQICSATSRLLLHTDIADRFLARLRLRAEALQCGDPFEDGCRLGPIVCKAQYDKVMALIQSGIDEGARVVTGAARPRGMTRGYYIMPTVFANVDTSMRIWREEIFGPVLAVKTFTSESEALTLANASPFGLAGAVMSRDAARCRRVAAALDVGIVWINCSQPCFCQAPWGGRKESGIGRELGVWGLRNYLSVKQVTEYTSNKRWDWYPERPVVSKL